MHIRVGGVDRVFVDRGGPLFGAGMPRYARAQGYTPYSEPTKVGARYFILGGEYDEETDQPIPDATGNKWDGGKPAYQQRVYNAAKKVGKDRGLSTKQIDALKPKVVA